MRKTLNKTPAEAIVVEEPLHIKYRPRSLQDVRGQDAVVDSLTTALKKSTRPHSFIFTGPSGCGKTTLARILAEKFGCSPQNVIEIDAATNNGIDSMREVTSTLRYNGFGDTPNKAIIIDECHALSKAAWQSLLKSVEEPPAHVFFFFCTTENGKVPETINTRCQSYFLKPLRFDDLMDLLEFVVDEEQLDPEPKLLEMVARACNGSPRQALVMLSMVQDCHELDEAARLLESPLDNKEIIDLCRQLVKGGLQWAEVTKTLKELGDMNPESIRIVIVNYLSACLMGAKNDKSAVYLLDALAQFSKPCNPSDKLAPILLAFGNLIFD